MYCKESRAGFSKEPKGGNKEAGRTSGGKSSNRNGTGIQIKRNAILSKTTTRILAGSVRGRIRMGSRLKI